MNDLRAVKDGNQQLIGYISMTDEGEECYAFEPHEVAETGPLSSGRRFTSIEKAEAHLLEVRQ